MSLYGDSMSTKVVSGAFIGPAVSFTVASGVSKHEI
jgi:hypothetical protein